MRTALMIAVAAGLAAAGCSEEKTTEAPGEQAAPAPKSRPAVYQAATKGPEAFVRALYAQYVPPGAGEAPPPPGQDPIFDRSLNALIRADFDKAAGEVPFLNYDPICGCQDGGAFSLDSVAITPGANADAVQAAVVFTNAGETTRQTLTLVREGGSWKVSDVLVPGQKPLSEQLTAAIS